MRVWHVENPIYYRKKHYPDIWDTIFDSPLSRVLRNLKEIPSTVKWLEDV